MLILQALQSGCGLRCLLLESLSMVGTELGQSVVVLLFSTRKMSSVFLLDGLGRLLVFGDRFGKGVCVLCLDFLQRLLGLLRAATSFLEMIGLEFA